METTTPAEFLANCQDLGFTPSVKRGLVSIRKGFAPGDSKAFVACDGDGPSLLSQVPIVSAGSTWGTDGATVGGMAAIKNGSYRLNVSGVSVRFTNKLGALLV